MKCIAFLFILIYTVPINRNKMKEDVLSQKKKLCWPIPGVWIPLLFSSGCTNAGSSSPYSLYNEDFATFGADEVYNQNDAEGFINLFSLPLKIRAIMNEKLKQEK